ncbi:MAG TPA: transcription termination/antitermination factor NusG [candidate division WOR-3 bacterium]|uniref:Transcription termination/antitermination protein NusG n=1 Tax=candidate division WOR-3 bacterium TaxID=2052148 RepID=A0A7C0X8D3_UNCW3|nr:transcription termination/antitermination factor NusG [candidate division WOR-3 bacterium]
MVKKETDKKPEKKRAEKDKEQSKKQKKWFVFWTLSGKERKVKRLLEKIIKEKGLQDKVGRVLIPTQTIPKVRKGKRYIQEKPLFKGYILIEMEADENLMETLTKIGSLRALIANDTLTSLSEEEVQRILETVEMEQQKKVQEVPFLKGEMVRVVDGPFMDFTGKVEEVYPDRGKLKVMVNIFGRVTPVVLDFLQVERI